MFSVRLRFNDDLSSAKVLYGSEEVLLFRYLSCFQSLQKEAVGI